MKKSRTIAAILVLLAVAAAIRMLWIKPPIKDSSAPISDNIQVANQSPSSTPSNDSVKTGGARFRLQQTGQTMTDVEFRRVRVSLPAPADEPWKGPLFDSNSCFDDDKKETAVDVLPVWLRKALDAGQQDVAARYLFSLFKLAGDKKPAVACRAVLEIYRLGDYDGFAAGKMRDWITSGLDYQYLETTSGSSDLKDIRAQILHELDLNNDTSLIPTIYEAWSKNRSNEGKDLASVDYGYYLEKHGSELPAEYWMNRLNNPYGFEGTLEIAEKRKLQGLREGLQGLFERLRAEQPSVAGSGQAALAASALLRLTGNGEYRDYLVGQSQAQISASSPDGSLALYLRALAMTGDKAGLDVLSTAMRKENEIVREMAIDALGSTPSSIGTDLLFDLANRKASEGKGFPARELNALIRQNTSEADAKYESLREALLSGRLAWTATARDFEQLEFFKKFRRR